MLLFSISALAADPKCASDLPGALALLGKDHQAATWIETTANDRKPLFIQLSEKDKKLFLFFFKTREGVWAEGTATLCEKSPGKPKLLAKIQKSDMTLGDSAPALIRMGFHDGAEFSLRLAEDGVLGISTFGWGSQFIPSSSDALNKAVQALKASSHAAVLLQ